MKTTILLLAVVFFSLNVNSQTWQWTHPEKNSNPPNNQYAHDIETDASGNAYVLGEFYDSLFLSNKYITGTAGKSGSYLAKYDSTGKLLWNKLIVPDGNYGDKPILATDLTITANGIYIIGKYLESYWDGYDCDEGGSGGKDYTYKIGSYSFVSAKNDIGFFVAKLNFNGGVVWNKTATRPYCYSFEGNTYYNNYSSVSYYPLLTSDKNNNIVCEFLNGGNYANSISISGYTVPVPKPTNNLAFIVFKMNPSGSVLWSNYAGYSENNVGPIQDCNSIITDNNGNIFMYGLANNNVQFGNIYYEAHYQGYSTFIAKISSAGVWQFAKELCIDSQNTLAAGNPDFMATDNNNNVYALVNHQNTYTHAGYTVIMGDTLLTNQTSYFPVKLNNTGNLIWHKGFGTTPDEGASESIHYANNSLYISGSIRHANYMGPWYFSDLTVIPTYPSSASSDEYFVSKADTSGSFKWFTSFASPYNYMSGFAVKAFNDNVYTAGIYRSYISSLGNLNGTYSTDYYLTDNIFFGKLKDQYIHVVAINPTQLIPGCTISIPFTSYGLNFSAKNKFYAELSNVNGDFSSVTVIGDTTSSGSGIINATIPATLSYGSGYRIRIRSSDTLKTGYNYFAYADTGYALILTCPPPSSGFASTNITANSATVSWTKVSCASGYRVKYRVKGTTAWITAGTLTNNNTTSLNITGLTPNTTYQWRVATRCKNNGVISFSTFASVKQFTTASAFAASGFDEVHVEGNSIITVQPNPTSSDALLKINGAVKDASIVITDFVGKTVWKAININSNIITLPAAHFSAGVYMVKITNGDETKIIKLVKQ